MKKQAEVVHGLYLDWLAGKDDSEVTKGALKEWGYDLFDKWNREGPDLGDEDDVVECPNCETLKQIEKHAEGTEYTCDYCRHYFTQVLLNKESLDRYNALLEATRMMRGSVKDWSPLAKRLLGK